MYYRLLDIGIEWLDGCVIWIKAISSFEQRSFVEIGKTTFVERIIDKLTPF